MNREKYRIKYTVKKTDGRILMSSKTTIIVPKNTSIDDLMRYLKRVVSLKIQGLYDVKFNWICIADSIKRCCV